LEDQLRIAESQLNALLRVIRGIGGSNDIEREVAEAVNSVHYGKAATEEELFELLRSVVSSSRPPILSSDWEEAWGNLFSHLIQLIMSSKSGTRRIISALYGREKIPEEAESELVLCVNPGSTSTKLALFRGFELEAADEVHIPPDFDDGVENRTKAIVEWIDERGIVPGGLTGIVCRGGFVQPVPSGTYEVCDEMVKDLEEPRIDHASNMAIPIGLKLGERLAGGGDLLITMSDPVATDEMEITARLTGIRKILRDGAGAHYLNHRAVHGLFCHLLGYERDEITTVSAHIGGGISIGRHKNGEIVDIVNAFSGVPSANRCGNIPLDCLMRALDSRKLTLQELSRYLFGEGGLVDLAGTNDFRALMHFMDTGAVQRQREKIKVVVDFLARNIAGEVMKLAAVEGAIDAVILTGGLSKSTEFSGIIRRKLYPYFPVAVVPGSVEHESMIAGHMRARFLREELKDYRVERDALRKKRAGEKEFLDTEIFAHPHLRKKENEPITSLDEVIYAARSLVAMHRAPRIALVGAENEDAVAAAKQANEEGRYPIAKFLLVGDFYEVNKLAWEYDIKVDDENYMIIDTDKPVEKAIELLDSGQVDLLMKGGVKTDEIMRGALRYMKSSGRLEKGKVYSHVGVFQFPAYPKLLIVTDAAVTPHPDQELKKLILENALAVAGYLNIKTPKVAVISAVETRNPSVQSSILAGEFAEGYRDRTDCIVEGPLSLDVALDPRSAEEKHYTGKISGNADILLMPDIEAGNVVYKTLTVSSGANLAGAVVGGGVPIILTSRGDSARSKLASISLAVLIAMRQEIAAKS